MIGSLIIDSDMRATLSDDGDWTSSDPLLQQFLNTEFSPKFATGLEAVLGMNGSIVAAADALGATYELQSPIEPLLDLHNQQQRDNSREIAEIMTATLHEDDIEQFLQPTVDEVANVFCPTGPGGGVDPSCSPTPSDSSASDAMEQRVADTLEIGLHKTAAVTKAVEHYVLDKLGIAQKEDEGESVSSKIPAPVKNAVKAGMAVAFSGWTVSQAMAERISTLKGTSPEKAAKLRASLAVADVLAFKPVAILTAPLGGIVGAASWVIPPVTGAYLAHSLVRHPIKTFRAATQLVTEFLDRHTDVINAETAIMVSSHQQIADALERHDYDDWYIALLHASAMDVTVADKLYAANPTDPSDQSGDQKDDEQWLRSLTGGDQ